MTTALELQCASVRGVELITVSGSLDTGTATLFETEVRRAMAAGVQVILVDAHELTFLDSAALGRVVAILKDLRRAGGRLAIACLSPHIRATLHLIRLDRFILLFDSVESALAGLASS